MFKVWRCVSEFHRLLEWLGFEVTFKGHLVQPCCKEQEYLQLDHDAQNLIQPDLEQFHDELLWPFRVRNPAILSKLKLLFVVSTKFKVIFLDFRLCLFYQHKSCMLEVHGLQNLQNLQLSADEVFYIFLSEISVSKYFQLQK